MCDVLLQVSECVLAAIERGVLVVMVLGSVCELFSVCQVSARLAQSVER